MDAYKHTVKYYETDRMGFAHHSNYIRWMEEARVDFFDQLGWSYSSFEDQGLISPVIAIECRYKHSMTFPDDIFITVSVEDYHSVKLKLKYIMANSEGSVVCEATSEHCFIGKDGRIVRIHKEYPELHRILTDLSKGV
ncbi:MAG: acyl-CoA thioesterase [Oscillospiraceae bacterium]|nr:acyl-CoA thioesterase [Oscillospiraceae bacterium]